MPLAENCRFGVAVLRDAPHDALDANSHFKEAVGVQYLVESLQRVDASFPESRIYISFVFFSEEFATCSPTEVPAE
jgi:hypothetical protein